MACPRPASWTQTRRGFLPISSRRRLGWGTWPAKAGPRSTAKSWRYGTKQGLWLDYREARDLKPARKKRRRTTAEYVRHYRERRRRGVRHVVQVEVTGDDLAALIERGLLTEAEAADRKSVAEVIEEKLVEFLRGGKKS